jgi:hypothetical protein
MSKEHLATYLNDHLAGSVIILELLHQLTAEAPDLAPHLRLLKSEIEADRLDLKRLMERLGIVESRVRKLGSWIAEKLTEVKLEVDDESGGALRLLECLEAISLGIEGKNALWAALRVAAATSAELQILDYGRLAERAVEQRRIVETFRLQAAAAPLSV